MHLTDDAGMVQPRAKPAQNPLAVSHAELGVLTVIIVIGIALRATRIGESLWYDEIAAWIGYGSHGPWFIVSEFHDPSNHVLHTLLSWLSVAMTESWLTIELQLRLPAFLASLGAIAATYALARRVAGLWVAAAAAALMAISPVCVLEGAEARGYSMMMLFSALMSLQLLIAYEKRNVLAWSLYALWCALGVWSHMMTVFIAFGHGVWLGTQLFHAMHRRTAVTGLLALVAAAALSLVLYAPMLSDVLGERDIISAGSSNQPGLFGTEGLHLVLQLGGAWLWYAALPGLVLIVIGIVVSLRKGEEHARDAILITLLGVPVFVLAVAALGTWVYARFALFALPGAALAAAIGWDWLRTRFGWAALALGVFVMAGSVVDLATRPPKQPMRSAMEYIIDHGGRGSRVMTISIAHSVFEAYVPGSTTSYALGTNLERDLAANKPAWVVVLYPNHVGDDRLALLVQRGFTLRAQFDGWVDWGEGDVLLYERTAP